MIKHDGKIRLCVDFKVSINQQIKVDQHPLPLIEETYAKLAGGVQFTKLDLWDAYLQMEVEEGSRDLLTVNTYKEGPVPVHEITFWGCISTCPVAACHGSVF